MPSLPASIVRLAFPTYSVEWLYYTNIYVLRAWCARAKPAELMSKNEGIQLVHSDLTLGGGEAAVPGGPTGGLCQGDPVGRGCCIGGVP